MSEVYSYHTFILPFIWEGKDHTSKSMDIISKCFEENPNWLNSDIVDNKFSEIKHIPGLDERLFYAEYQYFHPAVRKAIYGYDNDIVKNYIFMPELVNNKARYVIKKNDLDYSLIINAIRLKVFNTGIATLIFECENSEYRSLADVKNINDYGRRISVPFIPKNPDFSICADKLSVKIDESLIFEENFRNDFIENINATNNYNGTSLDHIADFIKQILGYGSDYNFTSIPTDDKNSIYIYSALDDRMFVACLVDDCKEANNFSCYWQNRKDSETEKSLYEFAFCDNDGNCSCQSQKMRKELLEKSIYDRWVDYGTLYSFTPQAMTCVLSNFEAGINSFLTQYIQICILCVVQRVSLVNFQDEALELTKRIETRGKAINRKTIAKLMNLQERFIAFQNQLNFHEVSSQEQAVDIYTIIKRNFYIDKQNDEIEQQLDLLYSAANINLDFGFNKGATILALIALAISLPNYFCFVDPEITLHSSLLNYSLILIVVCIVIYLTIKFLYRRNK